MGETAGKTVGRAQRLRRRMTPPEVRLWVRLRRGQGGARWRRQHPVGPWILDFWCAEAKLCVEVDGVWSHDWRVAERDARRTAWLEARGARVVRIGAADVMRDPDGLAAWVCEVARERAGR